MNNKQRIAIAVGAVIILLMLIFPPFHVEIYANATKVTLNKGYAFLFDPPKHGIITTSVDVALLLAQWVGTLLLTGFAFFILKIPDKPVKNHPIVDSAPSSMVESPKPESSSLVESPNLEMPIDQSKSFLGGKYHPWRRFFARMVDLYTTGLFLVLLAAYTVGTAIPPEMAESYVKMLDSSIVSGIFFCLFWVPVEATFLALFGTTPGNWVFGIHIMHLDGVRLSFFGALYRSFLVLVKGLALGIPFVAPLTALFQYRRLTRTGETSWDAETNSVVIHQKWGVIRSIMCIAIVCGVFALYTVLRSIGQY
jgi:uncharacterized RDD family membrane protein YckC